jgi:hypothetical protein
MLCGILCAVPAAIMVIHSPHFPTSSSPPVLSPCNALSCPFRSKKCVWSDVPAKSSYVVLPAKWGSPLWQRLLDAVVAFLSVVADLFLLVSLMLWVEWAFVFVGSGGTLARHE